MSNTNDSHQVYLDRLNKNNPHYKRQGQQQNQDTARDSGEYWQSESSSVRVPRVPRVPRPIGTPRLPPDIEMVEPQQQPDSQSGRKIVSVSGMPMLYSEAVKRQSILQLRKEQLSGSRSRQSYLEVARSPKPKQREEQQSGSRMPIINSDAAKRQSNLQPREEQPSGEESFTRRPAGEQMTEEERYKRWQEKKRKMEAGSNPPITSPQYEDSLMTVDESDEDSAIAGVYRADSTVSVRSSIYDFVEENGRTYHRFRDGKYMLPNDENEMERLDLQHYIWLMTTEGQLHLAPFDKPPARVLDVGTGSGIWAIEFGSDLSPVQPLLVPPNCHFEIDDLDDDWAYTQPFDYVHGRAMISCLKDPRHFFRQVYASLAPGGYLEMQDGVFPFKCVDSSADGSAVMQWCRQAIEGSTKIGRPWADTHNYPKYMEEVGFVNIRAFTYPWPFNTWPKDSKLKELGTWVQKDFLEGFPAAMRLWMLAYDWSLEQAEEFMERVRADLRNRSIHAYMEVIIVYGQKPELSEPASEGSSGSLENV
ncbi:hypothetical protein B7494_g5246 [Chlorociboria aeruginascens]|nr:hypothetical protein B7494_g5246 [Chlorociboria aeruginascens]